MVFGYIFNVIKRALLYQFLLIFVFYKYNDLSKFSNEFKVNVLEFADSFNFKHHILDNALQSPLTLFQIFLCFTALSAFLAIAGSKLAQFFSGMIVLFLGLVYHHPIKSVLLNIKNAQVINWTTFLPSWDIFLVACLGLGMIAHACTPCQKLSIKPKDEKEKENKAEPKQTQDREPKVSSKKQKKKL